MGKQIAKKIRGLSWTARISLILSFTVLFSVILYQGWYKPNYVQATTETFTSGSANWTVPAGVYSVTVECWGGGGAGGGNNTTADGGGGGGGGGYSKSVVSVTPGAIIPYVVGTGGTASAGANGGNGGDSSFNTTVVVAKGGTGGKAPVAGAGGVAGTGGAAGTGDVANAGGAGGAGRNANTGSGGGGGGSAGDTSVGGDGGAGGAAAAGIAGIAGTTNGANGGVGGYNNAGPGNIGGDGLAPGGGGGGSGDIATGSVAGGNGAAGKIVLTYVVATSPTVDTPTAASIASTTATLGATVSSDGGASITERGTVWGTATNPTGNKTTTTGTTGIFTTNVSGITPATKIFYRGYAINMIGTSYSPNGSFYTEPATQASGVTFTGVSGTGMTVNWTRGSGNGVIVLMKATTAVTGTPVDGTYTGYAANTVFGSGTLIGDGRVVYKGTGTSVSVSGLTNGTTYYVAVFEYAGTVDTSGVDQGTSYLVTSPATGNQLATTPADLTPPTVGTVTVTPTSTTFTSGSPTITATLTDTESAATSCEYTVNNGATWAAGVVSGASSPYTCTANPTGLIGAVTINVRGTSTGGTGTGTSVAYTADPSAPILSPPLIVAPGTSQNVISWSAGTDTGSGLKQYDLRFVAGTTPPATCADGTSVYTGTALTYTHPSLNNGTDYSYRLCAYDNVNNTATGITGTGTPVASGTATTLTAARTLVAATGSLADSTQNVLMEYLTLSSGTGGDAKVKLFTITMDDSTATATMYSAVKFYIDSTASTTLPATAVLLGGKARWDGTSTTFLLSGGSDTDRTITNGTPKYLYVVYDMAYGQTGKTAISRVTAVNVVTPDTSATGLTLTSNTISLTAGTNAAVNTACSDCHSYPPTDSTGGRNVPANSVVGSHAAHNASACSSCHFVPATQTSADFDHRSGNIQLLSSVSYSRGTNFPQTNDMTGAGLGTCATASCHGNVYGSGYNTTPTWGTASGCEACHSVAIGATGPATGSHALAGHATACTACHNAGTTSTTSPTTAHADGNIDIVNVGYPTNVAKHAAGSGYSTCTAASCHANVYGTGSSTTPAWGSTGSGCGACHSVTMDTTGPATGSHVAHNKTDCSLCHAGATNNTTLPTLNHINTTIEVTNTYSASPVAKHAAGSYTGTCSNATCHANVYGNGTVVTPVWGDATKGCGACHSIAIGSTGPATGSHALAGHSTSVPCTTCHNTGTTATTAPDTAHATGFIDVVNVGYPANVTKHTSGSGYSSCSAASCHADPYSASSAVTPVWGSTGSGCNACHSAYPITTAGPATGAHAKHMGLTGAACTDCHNSGTTATVVPSTAHADGDIDVTGGYPANYAKHAAGIGYSTCTASICHSSGQSTTGGATPVYAASPNWGSTGTNCGSCHKNMDTDAAAPGDHVKHAQTNNISCASCHNGYTETTVAAATHVNQLIETSFSGTLATGTTYSQANQAIGNGYGTCSTSYCHSTGQSTTGGATPTYPATPPTWGTTVTDCGSCHVNMDSNASATGDHVKHAQTYPFACATCHNGYTETTVNTATHVNKIIELTFSGNATGTTYSQGSGAVGNGFGTCSTSYCHSTGQSTTGGATPTYPATPPTWGTTVTNCGSCHLDFDTNVSATGDHVKHSQGTANFACATCHTGYTETTVNTATHVNKTIEVAISGTYAGGTYSGGTTGGNHAVGGGYGNCSATKCHGQGAPVWGGVLYSATVQCENCHGSATTSPFYSTAATGAAPTKTTAETDSKVGAHVGHLTARSGYTNPVTCGECHVVPATLTAAGHMDGSTTPTFSGDAVLNGASPTYATSTCTNTYCHGAKMPGGSANGTDTSPTWTNTAYLTGTPSATGDCKACHGCPPTGYAGSSHSGTETLADCNGCHTHVNTNGTFTAGANRALHMDGKVDASGGDCLGCHTGIKNNTSNADIDNNGVRAITPEFSRTSHHVTGVTLTKFHCVMCHMEGNTDGSKSGTLHENGQIDLRNVDTNTAIIWTGSEHTNMDNFCFACHDSNGVSNATVRGIVAGSTATNPFAGTLTNSYDQIARAGVVDVKTQFTTTNYSHHAVSGQKYTSATPLLSASPTRFVSTFTPLGGASSIRDTSTIHCGDCHTSGKWATVGGIGAHGSTNEYMLQTTSGTDTTHTSTDYVCFKCHVGSIYSTFGGKTLGGTGGHITGGNGSDYAHSAGLIGKSNRVANDGNIVGMTCANCHNCGVSGWGGIHGGNATYTDGASASQQTRRFMPGMANSKYIPSGWTGSTSTGCYTANDASGNWGSCNQHSGSAKGVTRLPRATSY